MPTRERERERGGKYRDLSYASPAAPSGSRSTFPRLAKKLAAGTWKRLFSARGGGGRLPAYGLGLLVDSSRGEFQGHHMGMDCCRRTNPFRLCSGLKVLGYFMILLVAAIIALSYCAVVVIAWGPRLFHGGLTSLLAFSIIIAFHLLLALLIWSYFRVAFVDPGSVPLNWRPPLEKENLEVGRSSVTSSDYVSPKTRASAWSGSEGLERRPTIGYCSRCQNSKPPGCHHCSVCQRCVLKMDHHCVWVVNCVGAIEAQFAQIGTAAIFRTFLTSRDPGPHLMPKEDWNLPENFPLPVPSWISEEDINYYASKFDKSGFTAPVNYYRCLNLNWDLTAPWTGAQIKVPVKFIVGDLDLTYHYPGAQWSM